MSRNAIVGLSFFFLFGALFFPMHCLHIYILKVSVVRNLLVVFELLKGSFMVLDIFALSFNIVYFKSEMYRIPYPLNANTNKVSGQHEYA